jgi:ABC-type branched-subunit amino acid transport system substrate-binding protein/serine/threonine protein kinase
MRYCINPHCPNPKNPDDPNRCKACGSCLIFSEWCYQAIRPLDKQEGRTPDERSDTRLYEVVDDEGKPGVLKVLTNNSSKLVELFEREAEVLRQLRHLGIPRFDNLFTFVPSNGTELRCLVMEEIEGQNLKQWLDNNGAISQDISLTWLRQLAEILDLVHRNRFLHQDIKPDNIMHTPDGRLVLIDFSDVPGIVSLGYTPPEQAEGKAVPQSDFFALGRTFVHLITGRHPLDLPKDSETCRLIWRPSAPQISPPLADLIDDLMAPFPGQRPENAQIILERINQIVNFSPLPSHPRIVKPKRPKIGMQNRWFIGATLLSVLALSGLVVAVIPKFLSSPPQPLSPSPPPTTCNSTLGDYLSCGEESLFGETLFPQKKEGINAFKDGNYSKAVALLTQARKHNLGDAETLIYLNNAKLAEQQTEVYTIAVVAPLGTRPQLGMEILRGVAQAQDKINRQKIYGKGLRVLIADDANKTEQALNVAEQLVKKSEILGVIGHYTSEMSLSVMKAGTYQRHHLALISYGSTSTELSPYGLMDDRVFFRTVPTTQAQAPQLSSYLINETRKRVVVFYNPESSYSRSLYEQFTLNFTAAGGEIVQVEDFNVCQVKFDADRALKQAQQKGATAIALFPDGQICLSISDKNTSNILTANGRANGTNFPMVGSWVLSRPDTLSSVGEYAVGKLVVAAPWHRLKSRNPEFIKEAETLWGKNELSDDGVNGITATSYDAARVLITALADKSQPTNRIEVQKVLAKEDFKATGATGTITFNGGDRKEAVNVLLKVVPSINCNTYGYSFVPIDYQLSQDGRLDCNAESTTAE